MLLFLLFPFSFFLFDGFDFFLHLLAFSFIQFPRRDHLKHIFLLVLLFLLSFGFLGLIALSAGSGGEWLAGLFALLDKDLLHVCEVVLVFDEQFQEAPLKLFLDDPAGKHRVVDELDEEFFEQVAHLQVFHNIQVVFSKQLVLDQPHLLCQVFVVGKLSILLHVSQQYLLYLEPFAISHIVANLFFLLVRCRDHCSLLIILGVLAG